MKESTSRREFLSGLSLLIGTTAASALLSKNALASALSYIPTKDSSTGVGKVFSKIELRLLKTICDLVLPRTETPSAGDVDVHGFIDHQLHHCHDDTDKQKIKSILILLEQSAHAREKKPFEQFTFSSQLQFVTALDAGQMGFNSVQQSQFRFLKSLICFGYYTTEVGATQELRYQAIPGGFKGTVAYKPEDKAWGSLGHSY